MKSALLIAILVAGTTTASQGQRADKSTNHYGKAEQEIRAVNREWADALVRRDFAAVDRIVADDFIIIGDNGGIANKPEYIAGLKSDSTMLETFDTDELQVRVYGKTAVLNGRWMAKIRDKGKVWNESGRYTDVYVKRNGRWQAVNSQSTPVKSPVKAPS